MILPYRVYLEVVRTYPGRIRAVYIRNVSRRPERISGIQALASFLDDLLGGEDDD